MQLAHMRVRGQYFSFMTWYLVLQVCMEVSHMCCKCRERGKLEMELAHTRAQMEQVVEADMEALQVNHWPTPCALDG